MPRPRRQQPGDAGPGLLLGALIGGLLSRHPAGAVVGAAVGGAATGQSGTTPIPLEVALRMFAEARGFRFISFARLGTHAGRLTLQGPAGYFFTDGAADPGLSVRVAIDDAIYDAIVGRLEEYGAVP